MFRLDENQEKDIRELMQIIADLKDPEDCLAFFSDLCTVQELLQLTNRVHVAKGLMEGQTYAEIRKQVPVSNATITRINTVLQYGMGGYHKAFAYLNCNKPTDSDSN